MSFYRKYRPQLVRQLDLIVIRENFEKILSSGSFSHACWRMGKHALPVF